MADERRKDPRFPMRIEAEVKFTSWHVFSLIYTINISQGGMNLEVLGDEPQVGTSLIVRMTLPKGPPIELEATVRHVTNTTSVKPQPPWGLGHLLLARKSAPIVSSPSLTGRPRKSDMSGWAAGQPSKRGSSRTSASRSVRASRSSWLTAPAGCASSTSP